MSEFNTTKEEFVKQTFLYLEDKLGASSAGIINKINSTPDFNKKVSLCRDVILSFKNNSLEHLRRHEKYKWEPVSVETFMLNDFYLGLGDVMFPKILEEIIELNSGKYVEAVLTGAIGVAKTTIAIWTTAYQIYLLSCLRNPQREYGLDPSSEITFIFQSISKELAEEVDYARFRTMIEGSPYFRKYFPFNADLTSQLKFPNRIVVKPVSGADTAAIGQNVMGGVIDELNFMAKVDKSKLSDSGGHYDQAIALYTSISRRRKTRFMSKGKLPGILCLVSSKRYPGQFTDSKVEESFLELERTGETSIFVYDKVTWDVLPEDRFTGAWFRMYIGDEFHKPRIIGDDEVPSAEEEPLIKLIPEEYRTDFESDPMGSLRDIAGVSTMALFPFFPDAEAVHSCFSEKTVSVLNTEVTDFQTLKVSIIKKNLKNHGYPRWVHIDLAVTGDSAGVTMGCVPDFVSVERGDETHEVLPNIEIDFSLEVRPPKGGEIIFSKIRTLLYKLREVGVNIKWVSFDSYQSVDSIQILRSKGFICGTQSMDTTTVPYDFLKTAIGDGRVRIPVHPHLQRELIGLERDQKNGKVDHPSRGSKDVADSLAGVVYGLTMRKEVWSGHGIPMRDVPLTVREALEKHGEGRR